MFKAFVRALVIAIIVAGCTSASSTPSPSVVASPSTPLGSADASPTPASTGSSAPSRAPLSARLPIRGSAREISDHVVLTAPRLGGGLYVLIPARVAPAVLALLDSTGQLRPGWPVALAGATFCERLLPVDDGSVRVICTLENPDGDMFSPTGAFAFDSNGRPLAGWPVALQGFTFMGRVVGDELALLAAGPLGDVIDAGPPTYEAGLMTVAAAAGALRSGARVPMDEVWWRAVWALGADGVAYGVAPASADPSPQKRVSWITALDLSGVRPGWPVSFDGFPSGPAFGPDGRIMLTVASSVARTSRVVAFDREGQRVAASSAELAIATVDEFTGQTGGCETFAPEPPRVAQDGTVFVYSSVRTGVFALDSYLAIMPGWPFEPAAPLARARPGFESEHEAGYCPGPVLPAVGPDRSLYLALQARDATVGGSLVAVGPDGRLRPGWPFRLSQPGAEFWSVVVGSDGTAYALAIDPEGVNASSATILAIASDGTVLWSSTIIDR